MPLSQLLSICSFAFMTPTEAAMGLEEVSGVLRKMN